MDLTQAGLNNNKKKQKMPSFFLEQKKILVFLHRF